MIRAADKRSVPNWLIGLALLVVVIGGFYMAMTKTVPFVGGGTEVKAVFTSAQNVRVNSPVRIAGVNVGKVTKVEPLAGSEDPDVSAQAAGDPEGSIPTTGAIVTMEVEDNALPIKEDAAFTLRPRLFLEGNLFVDVKPGSPSADEQDLDNAFTAEHTANSVQLDQVLSGALQSDNRANLQILLDQFGSALIDHGGAEGFRDFYKASAGANKSGSLVNEAVLGTRPHDLSGVVKNLDKVVDGLGKDEVALKGLVTNLRIVTGSFSAERASLERAVAELPNLLDAAQPALVNLNAAFPSLREFARTALPGVRSTPETLAKATPLIRQLRLLAQPNELRGLASDLRTTIPLLAKLNVRTIPFLRQSRALASCFNNVIIPWADSTVIPIDPTNQYPHDPVGTVYEETAYGLVGIGGESRSGDANGQYIRVQAGGGSNTVQTSDAAGNALAGVTPFEVLGAMPGLDDSAKTPFRPRVPCENQDVPNLQAGLGAGPPTSKVSASAPATGRVAELNSEAAKVLGKYVKAEKLAESGDQKASDRVRARADRAYANFGNGN